MDLEKIYGASYVNWEGVSASWAKRTVSSRLLLFAARRYLKESEARIDPERSELAGESGLPEEILAAFSSPPRPEEKAARRWGEFADAALAAELEMITYGERPPILAEVRAGLEAAANEAGKQTDLGRWFLDRRDALPGSDLPEDPGYMPV